MKVAVTGASGFIGQTLCPVLAAAGHEVNTKEAEAVVHLAGIAHRHASREELMRVNFELAVQVAKSAAANGASLIFLSSAKVHGERSRLPFIEGSPLAPEDDYAESKARAEEALRAIPGLRLVILRPPLVYGAGVKANFLALMTAIARGVPLPFGSVKNRRSIVYVRNLVDAIIRCLGLEGTFLVSDGDALSTPQLCREIGIALGRPARLFPFPPSLLPAKLGNSLVVDDSAIRRELGWQPPVTREKGLTETAAWFWARHNSRR